MRKKQLQGETKEVTRAQMADTEAGAQRTRQCTGGWSGGELAALKAQWPNSPKDNVRPYGVQSNGCFTKISLAAVPRVEEVIAYPHDVTACS